MGNLEKLTGIFDKISKPLELLEKKFSDISKKIEGMRDNLLQKMGFEMNEVTKETDNKLEQLKYETHLSNFKEKLTSFGIDEDIIKKQEKILNNLIDDPNVQNIDQTIKQIIEDMEEIVGKLINLTSKDKSILKNIQKKLDAGYNGKTPPISPIEILSVSKKHEVPVEYLMAFMQNDSHYGTNGARAIQNHNPGNVGNTDDGSNKYFSTWYQGIDAVGKNLKWRIKEYKKVHTTRKPTAQELANNQDIEGNGFLEKFKSTYKKENPDRKGAYMTAENGDDNVQKISATLADNGISNQEQYFA